MSVKDASDAGCHPLTPNRWADFERLLGGLECAGCWCMWWRLTQAQFDAQLGKANRRSMKALVEGGEVPGLLAYRDGVPVGWTSVAPRERFPRLDRSPILRRVDQTPVWSVARFFVDDLYRGQGIMDQLLRAAVDYAGEQGGTILEGYPILPKGARVADGTAFTGLARVFERVGFVEVARRSPTRPIMRYEIGG